MEKKTRRSTPRRLYYRPEKMRAAFMAGAWPVMPEPISVVVAFGTIEVRKEPGAR